MRNILPKLKHEIVLTYPRYFEHDGAKVKTHLHNMKMRLAYRGIRMFWFMEFQQRGAAHFHALLDKEISIEELRKIWYEIVGSNDARHLRKGAYSAPIRNNVAMSRYLTSYLTKQEQKTVPESFRNVGRYWGYSLSLITITTKLIFGSRAELQEIRKLFRSLRRYQEAKRRHWKSRKPLPKNPYSTYRRGDYLTLRDIRPVIEELRPRGLDVSLYEGEAEAGQAGFSPPDGPAPLTL